MFNIFRKFKNNLINNNDSKKIDNSSPTLGEVDERKYIYFGEVYTYEELTDKFGGISGNRSAVQRLERQGVVERVTLGDESKEQNYELIYTYRNKGYTRKELMDYLASYGFKPTNEEKYLRDEFEKNKISINKRYIAKKINKEIFDVPSIKLYIEHIEHKMKSTKRFSCGGPLSNGEYDIDFYEYVRMLIYPNLRAEGNESVMDIICIPQRERFRLNNEYNISYEIKNKMPFSNYIYGEVVIERSLSYTSCIRFSLRSTILEDFKKLDAIVEYMKNNIHLIMKQYK